MTTLKQRFEKATGYDTRYDELLSHIHSQMTDLENDGQYESKTYEQLVSLYKYLSSDEGRSARSDMMWEDVSSRLTEEELEKVIEVQTLINDNLELLNKSEASEECINKINLHLAEKVDIPIS